MSDSESDKTGVPLVENLSDSPQPKANTKRKRDNEEKQSAKRRRLKKPKDVDERALDAELGVNHAIAHMDSQLLADHVAQRTQRFRPDLSLVEKDEFHVPAAAIVDTTHWEKPRIKDTLPDYLQRYAKSRRKKKGQTLSDAPEAKGHPHTIVVAGSGLRAVELIRSLRKFQTKEAFVAKLFAKHIKLKEAVETLSKTSVNIGVGTPQRIMDLLDNGALSSADLERIIIDASFIDQKKRGILDMKETQVPLVRLLTRSELKKRYGDAGSKIELLFY
ncbi:Protein cms1 [Saxophila tyrrhenica]|uniref:Protein cms1 n=1 Tax=Saxophila tyrrhenica TaxID=1690608 RepID=A0AAV9NZ69_9PEZI|nr:Protein cms1 [Saxophila tyrrhenica]